MDYKNKEERKQLILERLQDLHNGCERCYEWSEYYSLEQLCEIEDNQLFI